MNELLTIVAGIGNIADNLNYTDEEKARDEAIKIQAAQQAAALAAAKAPNNTNTILMVGGGVVIVGLLGFAIFKMSK